MENHFHIPKLSDRLGSIAGMVSNGNSVCDVGCDHGFVSIYLVASGISPHVIAMDVRKGPLSRADEHIQAYKMENYIETRLSDGLAAYRAGEAQTLIVAGMGGPLMLRILESYPEKTGSFQELILQPQSEIPVFRSTIRKMGYEITEEKMVLEEGKYYPMMKVVPVQKQLTSLPELENTYGPHLLAERNPVLYQFLKKEETMVTELLERLQKEASDRKDVVQQWKHRYELCRKALELYEEKNGTAD